MTPLAGPAVPAATLASHEQGTIQPNGSNK